MNTGNQVLIVDDDAATLRSYAELLRAEGYKVSESSNGQTALHLARSHRPGFVLLDPMLLDGSAVELCRQIKADPALAGTFVILLERDTTHEQRKLLSSETVADDCLRKGLPSAVFRSRMRTLVRLRDTIAALKASEQRYQRLVEILPAAVGLVDPHGRLSSLSPPATAMLGCGHPGDGLPKTLFDITPPEDHERLRDDLAKALETGQVRDAEHTLLRPGGEPVPVELSATTSPGTNGQPACLFVAHDVTERKRLERDLLDISANERRRIGHELHDGLGQYLAGVAFRAKALEQQLAAASSPYLEESKELTRLISNAISQARDIARGLDPVEVERLGLPASLRNLAAETERLFDISCRFHCAARDLPIDHQAALALYRIVQEGIHNAITHGEARKIEVELSLDPGCLCLRIRDDGLGFQVHTPKHAGMGLRVMEYRARSIGAKLVVGSQPKRGTELRIEMPRKQASCLPAGPDGPSGGPVLKGKGEPKLSNAYGNCS